MFSCSLWASPENSQKLTQDAWLAITKNDHATAISKFETALIEDQNNYRAHIGLSLIYKMEKKLTKSAEHYEAALELMDSPEPYQFAYFDSKSLNSTINRNKKLVKRMTSALGKGDLDPLIEVNYKITCYNYYSQNKKLRKAEEALSDIGFVEDWYVAGPFPNAAGSGYNRVFPPEEEFELLKEYEGIYGNKATWRKAHKKASQLFMGFTDYFGFSTATYYATCFVYLPYRQPVNIRYGVEGYSKLFVNDDMVNSYDHEFALDIDRFVLETQLLEGWNKIMIKVCADEGNGQFGLRITDPEGKTIDGIKYSIEPQEYLTDFKPEVTIKKNPYLDFFEQQIEQYPEHYENYFLYSWCLNKVDLQEESEINLNNAGELLDYCSMTLFEKIRPMERLGKEDEINTIHERLYQEDKHLPESLLLKITQYAQNEDLDKVKEGIAYLDEYDFESENWYVAKFLESSLTEDVAGMYKYSSEGLEKNPDSYSLLTFNLLIQGQATKNYEEYRRILGKFLKDNYSKSLHRVYANSYLETNNTYSWEEELLKIINLDPEDAYIYYYAADEYHKREKYDKALEKVNEAIVLAPGWKNAYNLKGDILQAIGRKTEAILAYNKALEIYPQSYKIMTKYRESQDKPNIFSLFIEDDPDTIIAQSDTVETDKDVIYLLDTCKQVHYPRGGGQVMYESIIKIANKKGLQDYTELEIPYNYSKESINIEKAQAVKMNGEKVDADVSNNYIVFKNLEIGDCIHLKFKINNYYDYLLSTHLWNNWVFEGFYPIKESRYELLVPADKEFNYISKYMELEPEISESGDFKHYVWKMEDLDAIEYEYDMPPLSDVGKSVSVSSISDWNDIARWYKEITWSKPLVTYEIEEKVKELTEGKENLTDQEKIKLVYDYITENITYSSVPFRQSGHTPQKARIVLSTRIGDCKDVSTLAISMLRVMGIDAQYTLINTRDQGINKDELPSVNLFNHCIISIDTEEGRKFYDLTARNYPFCSLPLGDKNAFYLLIDDETQTPEYLDPEGYLVDKADFEQQIVTASDNSISVKETSFLSGGLSSFYRHSFRDVAQSDIEREMKENYTQIYPDVRINSLNFENLNEIKDNCIVNIDFDVPHYLMDMGSFKSLKLEWNFKMDSNVFLSYDERNFPIRDWIFFQELNEDIEVTLPDNLVPVELKESSVINSEFADYSLNLKYDNNTITGVRRIKIKKTDIEPVEYENFKSFYNEMIKIEEMQILLKSKN